MAYDTFEITGFKLRLDPDRAEAVMAVAREYGEEHEDVSDLLGDIFCCYDVDDDGTVTALEVEWWGGREFDDDYAFSVLAAAAGAEDHSRSGTPATSRKTSTGSSSTARVAMASSTSSSTAYP